MPFFRRCVTMAIGCAALSTASAWAQNMPALELFKQRDLLGAFAYDCKRPADQTNRDVSHRALDGGRVQTEETPVRGKPEIQVIWNAGVVLRRGQVGFTGVRDGKPTETTYLVEPGRYQMMQLTWGADVLQQHLMSPRAELWLHKCA